MDSKYQVACLFADKVNWIYPIYFYINISSCELSVYSVHTYYTHLFSFSFKSSSSTTSCCWRKLEINILVVLLPLDLAIRHPEETPCNTEDEIVRNVISQCFLPSWLFAELTVVSCPDLPPLTFVVLPCVLAFHPEEERQTTKLVLL